MTYKVRAAATFAAYVFVEADEPRQAERLVRRFVRKPEWDWEREAAHFHTTLEVEEAD